MNCIQCNTEIPESQLGHIIWTNMDGDAVCSEKCKKDREKEIDHFCSVILPNDNAYAAWLGVPVDWVRS